MRLVFCWALAISCCAATNPFLGGTAITDAKGRVTAVHLRSSWIDDSDLLEVARLNSATVLDLSETRITDIGFQALKSVPNVAELNLYYSELIGDGAMAALREWKHLRVLNLRGTKVTDAGLIPLAGLPIESLDVGYSLFTDNGFDALVNLPQLKRLAVGGNKLTDTGLNSVRLLTNLVELDISGNQRTDSGMWGATITDRSIETLNALPGLQVLNLRGSKFTDIGFAKLSRPVQLKILDLGDTNLSFTGLANLTKFGQLEQISFFKAKRVDDQVVPILKMLPKLRWVDLTETAVTADGVAAIRAAHPGCTVIWEPST